MEELVAILLSILILAFLIVAVGFACCIVVGAGFPFMMWLSDKIEKKLKLY